MVEYDYEEMDLSGTYQEIKKLNELVETGEWNRKYMPKKKIEDIESEEDRINSRFDILDLD